MNMLSRKIEERNEKIVRGLLKLPPNRRCINCDSLGPQYVCTNFWTFICTTCSGIHREFTHRVKSISMSKFTTQEVEALQNGGNQRAREIYLKGWDFQRQRLPSSSNVDKIREFIKNAYEDKKYTAGKVSDKPTDTQSPISHEDHKRASSYHSYSQSPPYDHQYEERRYGKRASVLTRKPGSERSLHIENVSSFLYSPHMSEKENDIRYSNEGSISRYSLHSESSGGDPFRSEIMSPNSYSNHGFSSPSARDSMERKNTTFVEEDARRDVNKVPPRPQRTLSSGSFGSYDRNSVSSNPYNSNSLVHTAPELDRNVVGSHIDLVVPSIEKQSSNDSYGTLDLFIGQVATQPATSSTVDFFQLPTNSASTLTISQASTFDTPATKNPFQSSKTPPSVDFFGNISEDKFHVTNLVQVPSEITKVKNEGWATFDAVPVASSHAVPIVNQPQKSDDGSIGNSVLMSPFIEKAHYEPLKSENQIQVHNATDESYTPVPSLWSNIVHKEALSGVAMSQPWSAFNDQIGHTQWESIPRKVEPHFAINTSPEDSNQFMNSIVTEGLIATNGSVPQNGPPFSSLYQPTSFELDPDQQAYTTTYTNPFELPFDSDSDTNKEFLNMNSLGDALPIDELPTTFPNEFANSWPSHYPAATLSSTAVQASIPYMAGQSQYSNFMDVSPHDPLTSIGGNPFA